MRNLTDLQNLTSSLNLQHLPLSLDQRELSSNFHLLNATTSSSFLCRATGFVTALKTFVAEEGSVTFALVIFISVVTLVAICARVIMDNRSEHEDDCSEHKDELQTQSPTGFEAGSRQVSPGTPAGSSEITTRELATTRGPIRKSPTEISRRSPSSMGLTPSTYGDIEGRTLRGHPFFRTIGEDYELPLGYFESSAAELVDRMGLSGLAILDPHKKSGINGLPLRVILPLLALQAWTLQLVLLVYMDAQLRRRPEGAAVKNLPLPVVFVAVYLHFVNCMTDVPFAVTVLRHIHHFHDNSKDLFVCVPVFVGDAIVIPFCSLIIGSLYLCTSETVGDVILNSCAVAFISNIDNYILEMNGRMNSMTGLGEHEAFQSQIVVPVDATFVEELNWWLCIVPVVPLLFATSQVYIGIFLLGL